MILHNIENPAVEDLKYGSIIVSQEAFIPISENIPL